VLSFIQAQTFGFGAAAEAPGGAPGTAPWTAPGGAPGTAPGGAPGGAPGTAPGGAPGGAPGTAPGGAGEAGEAGLVSSHKKIISVTHSENSQLSQHTKTQQNTTKHNKTQQNTNTNTNT
jgi:hypothetical protein